MTSKEHDLAQALPAMERLTDEAERVFLGRLMALNEMRKDAGLTPRQPKGGAAQEASEAGPSNSHIQDDTFFGKKRSTAIREYLEMRKAQGFGPAKPREIFDALQLGGHQFETKDETTALIGLRADLRKNTATFLKLPTGAYGLRAWYPNAKPVKDEDDEEPVTPKPKKKAGTAKRGRPRKAKAAARAEEKTETAAD